MTKKLILLVLAFPLLLMVCLFATTESVSLSISIPVSGIEIIGNEVVYLSLDDNEKYFVDYVIYPTNAENAEVTMTTEKIGDDRLAELDFEDGYIVPRSVGRAKVYINTVDGGYKDSFIVQVDSNRLQSIECSVAKSDIYVGDTLSITTTFVPATALNKVIKYSSDNENVAKVNNRGIITGVGRGSAKITIKSADNEQIFDTIDIQVNNKDILDLGQSNITSWNLEGSISLSVDTLESYTVSYLAKDSLGNDRSDIVNLELDEANKDNGQLALNYEITDSTFVGTIIVDITIKTENDFSLTKSATINIVDELEAHFISSQTPNYLVGEFNALLFVLDPYDADVSYDVASNNDNVIVQMNDDLLMVYGQKAGVSTITLTITSNYTNNQSIQISTDVVIAPRGFIINENANSYGIEGIHTIAQYNPDSTKTAHTLSLSYSKKSDKSDVGEGFLDNLTFVSSKPEKVEIDETGKITIKDSTMNEVVEFKGVYSYGTYKLETQPIKIKCVGGAWDVDNYLELLEAVNSNKEVVLQGNIKDDFGYDENGNLVYSLMTSTYDCDYYTNKGLSKPKVKVLLNIRKNVYGNGYEINADKITNKLDANGQLQNDAIFRGPLNFVALTDSSENGGAVSVKGQDNVVFAVYENVTLSNVELKSCDLNSGDSSSYDLSDLNYAGTTVEVLGDNVNIEYSRISNGRTVLRVFGDINDSDKNIHLNIKNSVLQNGREFIIRMGSNKFVTGTLENSSVNLPNSSLSSFPAHITYDNMSASEKLAYEEEFIRTYVNVKNCAFRNSGIFSIGIDSHFSGGLLADGENFLNNAKYNEMLAGWKDLAKTSYGAKLTFEEDVRIYDWKKLDNVDSSTLIEVMGFNDGSMFGSMELNVKDLVRELSEQDNYASILVKYNNEDYVHGGIAFFGGGKNYGVFDYTNYTSHTLSGYTVALSGTSVQYLTMAAGDQPFYFLLHDMTSSFSPQQQENLLKTNEAYSFVSPLYN